MKKHMFTYNYYRYRAIDNNRGFSRYLFELIIIASIIFLFCVLVF